MLTEKPWRSEAILRLVVSVFICHFLGSVVMAVVRFHGGARPINEWVFAALVVTALASCGAALFILRKAWDLERFTKPFVLMIFFLYLGLTFGAFVQHFAGKPGEDHPTLRTVMASLSFQGAALLLVWRFTREHVTSWRDAFGFPVNWQRALLYGVLAACIFLPFGWLLQMASAELMTRANVKTEIQPAVQALKHTVTWLDRAAVGIVAMGLAPAAEELLFRGILYPAIKQAGFPRLALWGTSVLFAAIHVNLMTFVPLLLFALVLAQLYERTGNLLAPLAAHAVFNALNFAKFFFFELKFGQPG